jgi:malonyl CoA-acyl carrier protein transacylase
LICVLFPGQPLSFGPPLPADPEGDALRILSVERASFDLDSREFRGGPSTENVKLQLHGVASSLCHFRRLLRQGARPALLSGHSMGIYPALAAAAVLGDGDVLELAYRAGARMARMSETGEYRLACVVGLRRDRVESAARGNGAFLANLNTSRHFLLSGPRDSVEGAAGEALAAGARSAACFPCDAPLHTPLMEEVRRPMEEIFSSFPYRPGVLPILESVSQRILSPDDLPSFLFEELVRPVSWEATYRALRVAGATRFLEAGDDLSLRKYNRWIDSEERP